MNTISDIGERNLIQIASAIYHKDSEFDFTDDCAILPVNDEYLLATTDMISEKTHVPKGMTPWDVGWFIVAINLSDIAAKGGYPIGLLLSIGLPSSYEESSFVDLIKGAHSCATRYKTSIIGGDTKEQEYVVLSGTALGKVRKNLIMTRNGAKPGDAVAVTGTLGKAAAGFYTLKQTEKTDKKNPLCRPQPRIKEGQLLAKTMKVHCCMDISDGLSSSLYQLAELNDVGFEIDQKKLPISPALFDHAKNDSTIDELYSSLHFGGDYELLFTAPKKDMPILNEALHSYDTSLTVIGRVSKDKKIQLLTLENDTILLPNLGYEHFKNI